jgi:hypothetical protein
MSRTLVTMAELGVEVEAAARAKLAAVYDQ